MIGAKWCNWTTDAKSRFMSLGPIKTICGKQVAFRYLDGETDKEHLPLEVVDYYPIFCLVYQDKLHLFEGPRVEQYWIEFVRKTLEDNSF
jgi:hypothetical protein